MIDIEPSKRPYGETDSAGGAQKKAEPMIDIEIPDKYREAWRIANQFPKPSEIGNLCDALVWAIAGWAEERFTREHRVDGRGYLRWCYQCKYGSDKERTDPRHSWDSEQWREAVREKLEAK